MEMPTSKSPGNTTTHSQTLSFDNRNNVLRDASFSSYLNKAEENFLLKLTQEITSPTTTMSPQAGHHLRVGRVLKDVEDEEIGVFGAEKYFQGEILEETLVKPKKDFLYGPKYHLHEKGCSTAPIKSTQSSPNYLVSANMCPAKDKKELQGALSVRSESSLNSRSALLHRIPRSQARGRDVNKGGNVKSFLASLGCNCNDRTSVEVDDQQLAEKSANSWEMAKPPSETADVVPETKSLSSSTWGEDGIHQHLKREECFSFPVLGNSNPPGNIAVKRNQLQEGEKEKAPLNLEKKLSMLTNHWNVVIPREEEIDIPSNGMYNDAASDASSDLFEIESFSTNGNSILARQASDGITSPRCVSPRNCYAPSEVSIEWSVVTASAADFSTFSDYESVRGNSRNLDSMVRNAKIGKPAKDMQIKRRPGILSGCKSHKAVRVVENGYKTGGGQNVSSSEQEGRHGYLGPITPADTRFRDADTRFRAATTSKLTRHQTFDMCSLPQSHSPHLLYSR